MAIRSLNQPEGHGVWLLECRPDLYDATDSNNWKEGRLFVPGEVFKDLQIYIPQHPFSKFFLGDWDKGATRSG